MSDLIKRAKSLFRTPEREPAKAPAARKPVKPWHSVSIVPGERLCKAARALKDERFLSREAPTLPLKGCDQPVCKCRYAHYDDRRQGPRRVSILSGPVSGAGKSERRVTAGRSGRRRTDP